MSQQMQGNLKKKIKGRIWNAPSVISQTRPAPTHTHTRRRCCCRSTKLYFTSYPPSALPVSFTGRFSYRPHKGGVRHAMSGPVRHHPSLLFLLLPFLSALRLPLSQSLLAYLPHAAAAACYPASYLYLPFPTSIRIPPYSAIAGTGSIASQTRQADVAPGAPSGTSSRSWGPKAGSHIRRRE